MLGIAALCLTLAAVGRWFWRAWRVDIPRSPRAFQAVWAGGLLLGLIALGSAGGAAAWWAVALSSLMLYLSTTGKQKTGTDAIRVGDTVPAFTAPDADDALFDSASLAGQRFLLKVFRGHW